MVTYEVSLSSSYSETDKVWALHNPIKSWMLYNLTEAEIRLIILTLSVNEIRSLRISKKQGKDWSVLQKEQYPGFFDQTMTENYFASAAYAEIIEQPENTAADREYFIIEPKKVKHPRLHQRYEVGVKCRIVGGDSKEFETESVDLSVGGLYFKDLIPSWVAGYFLVVVDGKFRLMCSLVEDQKEKRRVQIVSEETDYHFVQFKNWLTSLS